MDKLSLMVIYILVLLVTIIIIIYCTRSKHSIRSIQNYRPITSSDLTIIPVTGFSMPYKVTYLNNDDITWYLATPNQPWPTIVDAVTAGYNVIIVTFVVSGGPIGNIQMWGPASATAGGASLSVDQQIASINYAHQHGAIILASAGGSTDIPYLTTSANDYGTSAAQWVMNNYLDGIDFDMENISPGFINPVNSGGGVNNIVQWITNVSISAKNTFNAQKYTSIITHAPQAPYFGNWTGTSGGYTTIYKNSQLAGLPIINWFNLQYYNQGGTCYTTYNGIFTSSVSDCSTFPGTSIKEISTYGIPVSSLVVGKPYNQTGDAGNGWVDLNTLNTWLQTATSDTNISPTGYNSGIMFWSFHGTVSPWPPS